MSSFLWILLLVFLGSGLSILGGYLIFWKKKWSDCALLRLVSYAAGVLIAVTFLDLLPEAIAAGGENVSLLVLTGLVIFFLIEDFLLHPHHKEDEKKEVKPVVSLIITSDVIHNFIDGVVIASSFLADFRLGILVSFSTFIHEIPKELGDFSLLIKNGLSKKKALMVNILSAVGAFAGAILSFVAIEYSQKIIVPLLGLATGMFLYISSADILPELLKGKGKVGKWHVSGFFLLGIATIYILTRVIPE